MKKIAFTCAACGVLNVPGVGETWRGYARCQGCDSMQNVVTSGEGRTSPGLYRELSRRVGLSVSMILELQKRGLLPRDLASCSHEHFVVACAVNLAISSEEILRGGLARLPRQRREDLVHAVASDALLTRWQRDILDRYVKEYRDELEFNLQPTGKRGSRYGSLVTSIPAMILYLEQRYGLPAASSRPWIKKLKKVAYNRARRAVEGGGATNA